MVDFKRRTTLKAISGAAVVVATPSIASAGYGNTDLDDAQSEQLATEVIVPVNAGAELSIALNVDAEPTVRLTNNSDKLLIVRHVYPGIIHAGAQTFDINSIFTSSAYAIGAGSTRTVKIQPMVGIQAETEFPRERYRNKPQRIVKVTGKDHIGDIVNSTRSFFA